MKFLSMAEIAEVFGISSPAVHKWIERGCPYVKKGQGGKVYQFSLPEVLEWKSRNMSQSVYSTAKETSMTKEEALMAACDLLEHWLPFVDFKALQAKEDRGGGGKSSFPGLIR